jgi:hypothetical protein
MADGSIIIDTKLNITGAKRDMKELTSSINETQTQMDLLVDKFIESKRHIKNLSDKDLDRMVNNFKQSNAEYQGLVAKQKELTAGVKQYEKALTGTTKASTKVTANFSGIGKAITRGVKSLARFSLALVGMVGISGIISSSIREWAESGDEKAQQLQANIKQLKSAIGASLAPAIEYVLKLFYNVLGAVNSILKACTGINLLSKSTAKSTGQTAKNAKGTLGSFDELNTLMKGDESAGAGEPTGNLQSVVQDFTNLENLIMEKDWYGVGEYIAENINKGIEKISINIGLGETSGEGFAQGFNGLIANVKWDLLGQQISDGILSALNFANSAVDKFDWEKLGESIYISLINIKWAEIMENVVNFIGYSIKGLGSLIWGILKLAFEDLKEFFTPYIEEMGGDIGGGILIGIIYAFENIFGWIKEHIFDPIVNAIKNLFGIHSPSTVMAELGGYIVEGLKNGIVEKWESITQWFDINVAPKLKASYWIDKLKSMKQGITQAFKETFNGIISIVENAVNFIIEKINTLSWEIPDWVPGIGGGTFGFDFEPIKIPRLAKGGIAYQPTQAIIGESGREAVLPLENNTEWMDDLAERISLNQNVNIEFTGSLSQLARVLNPVIKKEQTRAGARLIGGAV